MLKIFGAALLAALLAACASPLSGDYAKGHGKTLMVSKRVWSGYQEYVGLIGGTNRGDFVVTVLNGVALGYHAQYCPGTSCITVGSRASSLMSECKAEGPQVQCVLFAQSSEILVDYKLVDE